jgi:hypothetical protein
MTVRRIKKEMAPANNQMQSQVAPEQEPQIPNHSHPEYDQMLVKIQELESKLAGEDKGINQDADKVKAQDNEQKMNESIRKIVREELKGVPSFDSGKVDKKPMGPENTNEVPQSTHLQPDGKPEGEFDAEDKLNEEDANKAAKQAEMPEEDYQKPKIQKNQLDEVAKLLEKVKSLLKENNGEDPSQPNAGAVEKKPEPMDMSAPKDSVKEEVKPMENEGSEEDKKEDEKEEDNVKKAFESIKNELKQEFATKRQSMVGIATLNEKNDVSTKNAEFASHKEAVTGSIKDYLKKAGHNSALSHMSRY